MRVFIEPVQNITPIATNSNKYYIYTGFTFWSQLEMATWRRARRGDDYFFSFLAFQLYCGKASGSSACAEALSRRIRPHFASLSAEE